MSTNFPTSVDSYTTKVNNVTQVMAADVNNLQDAMVAVQTSVIALSPNPNLLYHSLSHNIWLSGTTFNDVADDTYVATLWNALWSGNAPDVSQSGTGLKCLFDAAGCQAGFVQFLTSEDSVPLRGKKLSFSIDVVTFNVTNMRCAILEWTGTADAITSDVVATWAANPTLATNWAVVGAAPVSQAISGTTRIEAEARTIGSTTNNIAVFVWTPDTEGSTDYFTLSNAKLEIGSAATPFVAPNYAAEFDVITKMYQKSYDTTVAPGTADIDGAINWETRTAIAASTAGTLFTSAGRFNTSMHRVPNVFLYSPDTGTVDAIRNAAAATDRTGASAQGVGVNGFGWIAISNASANAIGLDHILRLHFVADARL